MSSSESIYLSSEDTLVERPYEETPSTEPSIPSTPKMSIVEERSVPWDTDEEQVAQEAEEGFSEYLEVLDEDKRRQDEMIRQLTEDFDRPSPSRSPSPPPLIRTQSEGIIFPDRETYLTTFIAYIMGLIEGTPNTEFVSGPTRPEIQRALEILEEERSFVQHAQRALQIREGILIARINAGERRLMGLNQTPHLQDSFHPADDITPLWYLVPRLRPQMEHRFAQCRGLIPWNAAGEEIFIDSRRFHPATTSYPRDWDMTPASPTPSPSSSALEVLEERDDDVWYDVKLLGQTTVRIHWAGTHCHNETRDSVSERSSRMVGNKILQRRVEALGYPLLSNLRTAVHTVSSDSKALV
ncbi:hypothetical protein HETIRDRAFT_114754 [Heterobasidion irregulare TC 32-1]|uniref:Uncharacterized protein n=1 Tax=Heterobasidion irregulare (strain TC 32-1) TaxID=747525 RepID=W4KPS4_HETIT|nr:uncharacterized protein HETIRDRAFT_114754 [Heterobasidion irregulare TC 32-1]ETW87792.1 hypothetical protein HETIRDRAFT_114754 [Heterobasidion irregulare TC 32-1]